MSQPPNYGFIFETIYPNSAYTQSALTKIIANMSTLVAMWARISTGYDPIPPSKEMSYAKNFLAMSFGEEPDDDSVSLHSARAILFENLPTHRYWAIHHL
jgi:citrate synthase